MKDEAAVRNRFTLKQQVEELQKLFKMIEDHYERNRQTKSTGANGDTV